jgi:hypothetical protein
LPFILPGAQEREAAAPQGKRKKAKGKKPLAIFAKRKHEVETLPCGVEKAVAARVRIFISRMPMRFVIST